MNSEELEAMYKLVFFGGHQNGVHWHPNGPHVWVGRFSTPFPGQTFYVRTCVCDAYERWEEK